MAIGNTFGATVLSSYGGFWISAAIVFTPRRLRDYAHTRENRRPGNVLRFFLHIPLGKHPNQPRQPNQSYSIIPHSNPKLTLNNQKQQGWFIFTTIITSLTLRSTLALCALFVVVDTSVLLALTYMIRDKSEMPHAGLHKAGGLFAILTAFLVWYNGMAGLVDYSNSFFLWCLLCMSEKGRESRKND